LFGLQPEPSPELREKIDAGKVMLGGCCMPHEGVDAIWACADCQTGYAREKTAGLPDES